MRLVTEESPFFLIMKRELSPIAGPRKIRVVVFGHPQDRAEMLQIATELLRVSDCEVCLQSFDPNLSAEEVLLRIREFSVAVFAVSEAFLKEENVARQSFLPRAVSDRIRILPIKTVGAGNVGGLFSKLCGHLHLLDRNAEDYPKQLVSYCDQQIDPYHMMWLSPEEEKVRRELFVGKAFLSYRKKDAGFLYRLLDFLREIPELADLAIFYDKALIPGEDFSQQLQEEMKSSQIVFFVVTPQILEEGNYVIREEYPQAVAEGKLLIPVILEETDRTRLSEVFPEFRAVWDLRERDALRQFLINVRTGFGKIGKFSPMKKHFLAYAYENGEGTERNTAFSNRLFQEAAEEGFLSAKAKLVLQHIDGIVGDRYEGETEELLKDAMYSYAEALETMPAEPENRPFGISLFRFSVELFELLKRKPGYEHDTMWDCILCSKRAIDFLRELNQRILSVPELMAAELHLSEGNLEQAKFDLALAREKLKQYEEEFPGTPILEQERARLMLLQGRYNVRMLLSGDIREVEANVWRYYLSYESPSEMKAILDRYTEWYVLDVPEETLREMFCYSDPFFLPEGSLGSVSGNYTASSHKCPECESRLYRSVFPEENDPELFLGGNHGGSFCPARVFACPKCGRFYATVKRRRLEEGPVYTVKLYSTGENKAGMLLSRMWWAYFDRIGDLETVRKKE